MPTASKNISMHNIIMKEARTSRFSQGCERAGEKAPDKEFGQRRLHIASAFGALGLSVLTALGCGSPKTAPDTKDAIASMQSGKAAKGNLDAISAEVSTEASDASVGSSQSGQEEEQAFDGVGNLRQLLRGLRSSNPEIMENAVNDLVRIRDGVHSKLMDILLRGELPEVRDRSPEFSTARRNAERFENIEDAKIVPALMRRVSDGDAGVRCIAVRALAYFGNDSRVVQPLTERLSDYSVEVRSETVRAFMSIISHYNMASQCDSCGSLGTRARHVMQAVSEAVPALIERLSDSDAEVQEEIANVLSLIGDVRALPKLRELAARADEEPEVLSAVEDAINHIVYLQANNEK